MKRWIPDGDQMFHVTFHSAMISFAGGYDGGLMFVLRCFGILFAGFTVIAIIGKRFT